MGWIVVVALVLLVMIVIGMYNSLVRLRAACDSAWADIDVQLKRRYDLIPNLVETVKAYAAHEKGALEAVINARAKAMSAQGPEAKGCGGEPTEPIVEITLRACRSLPAIAGGGGLQSTPGQPQSNRRRRAERQALLQRRGPRLQCEDPGDPHQPHCRLVQFRRPPVLRTHGHHPARATKGAVLAWADPPVHM
jgi:hypothetical protein